MNASICDLTLYDIMAQDLTIWMGKNKEGFTLHIWGDEKSSPEIEEKNVHPFAVESLATFCRDFLHNYDRISKQGDIA